jgi:hypothetical protein
MNSPSNGNGLYQSIPVNTSQYQSIPANEPALACVGEVLGEAGIWAKGRSLRINHHLSKCTYRYKNLVTEIKHYKANRSLVLYKLVCGTRSGGSVPKQTIPTCHRGTSLIRTVAVNERMHFKWTLALLRPCPGRQGLNNT